MPERCTVISLQISHVDLVRWAGGGTVVVVCRRWMGETVAAKREGLLSQGVCKEHGNNYLTQQSREFVHGPGVSRAGWCNAPGSLHHYTNVFTGYQASYMPFQSLVAAQRYPIKSEPSFEQESSHHHHTIMAYIHTYARAGVRVTTLHETVRVLQICATLSLKWRRFRTGRHLLAVHFASRSVYLYGCAREMFLPLARMWVK